MENMDLGAPILPLHGSKMKKALALIPGAKGVNWTQTDFDLRRSGGGTFYYSGSDDWTCKVQVLPGEFKLEAWHGVHPLESFKVDIHDLEKESV